MNQILSSLVKLGVTIYLLFGGYTLFCGFLEKSRRKKIAGALILLIPTVILITLIVILSKKYGA